jgi:hypothetical protein
MEYIRTDEDALLMAPIKMTLGEKEYDVPLLRRRAACEWRKGFWQHVVGIFDHLKVEANPERVNAFASSLAFIFLQFPERIADIVYSYAGDSLSREEIDETATEEQMAQAFQKIVKVAVFPYVGELATMTQVLNMAASFPQPPKFTK